MQQTAVAAPEGREFGPYRLVEAVGQGALTTVYRAYQPALRRWVAVKLLPAPAAPEEFPARFVRAAEDWARLEHPHILALHDYGQCQGVPYLAMPYVEGSSFEARLAAGAPREWALGMLLQVCGALAYAHRQRVAHGDVTPASVLLREERWPALANFGMGRLLAATGAACEHGVFGTPEYLAPEQVRGAPIDGRADVYALGIMLYRILAGAPPFTAPTAEQVLARQCETPPRPLELPQAEASRAWNAVLARALAKPPGDRYPTAEALAAAIQTAMQREQAARREAEAAPGVWWAAGARGGRAAGPAPGAAGVAGAGRAPGQETGGPRGGTRTARGNGRRGGLSVSPLVWAALGAVLALALLVVLVTRSPGVPDTPAGSAPAPAANVSAAGSADAPDEEDAGPPGPVVLLEDDFADPASGWPRLSSDLSTRRIGYVDGEYSIVKVANTQGAPFVTREAQFGDFLWEIDVRLQEPTENAYAYLDFRRQDNGDHYSFVVDPNDSTFQVQREIGQTRDDLIGWTRSAAIRRGTVQNRLGVRAESGEIVLLANGEEIARVEDDRLGSGSLAFGVGNFRNGSADGRFDNLLVTAIPAT
ncbi:MAG TPA: serine/threonine-protein kinase [Chloroflexota bacterium]|jgi:hypothetical protein